MASAPRDTDRFFELALDLLVVVGPDASFLSVNPAFTEALGWTADEVEGTPCLDIVHPADAQATRVAFASLRDGAVVKPLTHRCRTRDGHWRRIEWTAQRPEDGPFVYCVGRDVTEAHERRRAERALNGAWLAVTTSGDLSETLQVVAEQACGLVGAEQGYVSLTDRRTGQVASACHLSERYASFRGSAPPPPTEGIYTLPIATNLSMRLTQEQLAAHAAPEPADGDRATPRPPMRGWLAVPLVASDEENLGLIQLSDKSDGTDFDAADEQALRELGRVAAVTIERVRAEELAALERERAETILSSIRDAFFSVDAAWRLTYVNAAAAALVRSEPEDLIGEVLWDVVPGLRDGPIGQRYQGVAATGAPAVFVETYPALGLWFDIRAYPTGDGLTVSLLDVTERIATTQDLAARVAQQRVVADVGQAALGGVGLQELLDLALGRVGEVVGAQTALIVEVVPGSMFLRRRSVWPEGFPSPVEMPHIAGMSLSEALRTGELVVIEDYERQPEEQAREAARSIGVRSGMAIPLGAADAPWAVLAVAFEQPTKPPERDLLFLRQIAHVITTAMERHRTEERVRHQATHDALTGLPNRELLRIRLEEATEQAFVGQGCAGLLLLDLDGFKDVNDSLGHATGDLVLEQVAERLRGVLGEDQFVGRLGGDEFGICLRHCAGPPDVLEQAEVVRLALQRPFALPELDVALSASVGVAVAPGHGTDGSTLMRHADVAMYRAKISGDAVALYDPAIDAARTERLAFVADLRSSIADEHFEVEYQPIVDLPTGRPVALEALVRWRSPTRGRVAPDDFIPLAEQSGLIGPLTELVVEHVAAASLAIGGRLRIAVNFSVVATLDADVADRLVDRLIGARDAMTVEITESSLANRRALAVLDRLAAGGVSCSIDDFGTGWSSMASLKTLPVRQLKIDRAFVAGIDREGSDEAIVRSVVDLGRALGLDVVAEGVETEHAVERLAAAGVTLVQGFVFARPMPLEALVPWLDERA